MGGGNQPLSPRAKRQDALDAFGSGELLRFSVVVLGRAGERVMNDAHPWMQRRIEQVAGELAAQGRAFDAGEIARRAGVSRHVVITFQRARDRGRRRQRVSSAQGDPSAQGLDGSIHVVTACAVEHCGGRVSVSFAPGSTPHPQTTRCETCGTEWLLLGGVLVPVD
jgi:hypothetical protein